MDRKQKIEYILNSCPDILLNQFVTIINLITTFQSKQFGSNKKKNEFINDSYNALNVISKLICMVSNNTNLDNLQYDKSQQEEINRNRLNQSLNNTKETFSKLTRNAKEYNAKHQEAQELSEFSKAVVERAVGKVIPNEELETMSYSSLTMSNIDDNI